MYEDFDTLMMTELQWKNGTADVKANLLQHRIIRIDNGDFIVGFSDIMSGYIAKHAYLTQFPAALLKLDERNPAAYMLGKKMAEHYFMYRNMSRESHNILSVKTLLDWADDVIPSKNVVKSENRTYNERIVIPFEHALNALVEVGVLDNWQYCQARKEPLTVERLNNLSYQEIAELYIHFELRIDPIKKETLLVTAGDKSKRLQAAKKKRGKSGKKSKENKGDTQ